MKIPVRLLLCAALVACSDSEPAPGAGASSSGGSSSSDDGASGSDSGGSAERLPLPTGADATGSITGVVRVTGSYERPPLSIRGQSGCDHGGAPEPLSDHVVVGPDGGLAGVLVHVKGGLEGWQMPDPPAEPVVLSQEGCMYTPHVVALQVGQPLAVRNSDPTTHNVNAKMKRNRATNRAQSEGGPDLEFAMTKPELSVLFACDLHPWMSARVHAVGHPFFQVTGPDGSFTIEGLPPGSYEVEVIHENKDFGKKGKAQAEAEVVAGQATSLEFVLD